MVGDGPLRADVAGDARRAPASRPGVAARRARRRADVLRGLDCFVLPSLAEGISNTILEAMASGLPVIATDVGGNAELVEDGAPARSFRRPTARRWRAAIVALFDEPGACATRGTARAARQVAVQRFSLDAMVARLSRRSTMRCSRRPQVAAADVGRGAAALASTSREGQRHVRHHRHLRHARRSARSIAALLARMNESQHHRGPDEGGMHVEPGVGLGHRRLSIIDVATGQQPLFNEDGSVVRDLQRRDLQLPGADPRAGRAGPRVPHAERHRGDRARVGGVGRGCVERFRGMFAFALWDRNRETLFLARDRLGVKPLHYAVLTTAAAVRLRAEVAARARRACGATSTRAPSRSTSRSATSPSRARIFRGARKLPPAHTLAIRRGQPMPRRRANTGTCASRSTSHQRRAKPARSSSQRLDESVRLRMISEVPLGAFLSGGVDSSAVVATMAGALGRPGQHLLDRVRRPGVRRVGVRARGRRPLPHAPLRRDASRATTST